METASDREVQKYLLGTGPVVETYWEIPALPDRQGESIGADWSSI